jgi:hypothetical protein
MAKQKLKSTNWKKLQADILEKLQAEKSIKWQKQNGKSKN